MNNASKQTTPGESRTAVESIDRPDASALYATKTEARDAYRSSPADFFERYHHRHDDETALISPDWRTFEARYHYNMVENGVIDVLRAHTPDMTGLHVLDVGSGTGHWVEFFSKVLEARSVVATDFSEVAADRLAARFSTRTDITIRRMDISEPEPSFRARFDVVNAIGVVFHIVDDVRWVRTIGNIVEYLAPEGVAVIGGDFGDRTEELGVMRKVRSLAAWDEVLNRAGARRVELIRFDWFKGGVNRGLKNNLLAFRRRPGGGG